MLARVQEMADKKAALLEGKARREARTRAVAKRSASVVRLMELEAEAIRLEKEAVVSLVAKRFIVARCGFFSLACCFGFCTYICFLPAGTPRKFTWKH